MIAPSLWLSTMFHVKQFARLDAFVALLLEWQATTNLIAPSTIREVWSRHVADSLQLLKFAPDTGTWMDLGSGGGFPGMVIACALTLPSGNAPRREQRQEGRVPA